MRSRKGSPRRSAAASRNAVDEESPGMDGLQVRMLEYSIGASVNAPLESAVIPYVLSRTKDGVATLTLNRGERFNPLSRAMIAGLQSEIDRIAGDASVRSVVIAAEGRGFCAGHDLKELRAHRDLAWQQELFGACNALMLSLTRLPQPVIARVHGIATAAGCQLVSMCDLAV